MKTLQVKARIVGILYIIGTVAGILSVVFTNSIRSATDSLSVIAGDTNSIVAGALFVICMELALLMIPVVMYPVLKKQSETLALGYVIFRSVLEAITYLAIAISWLFLPIISQTYMQEGAAHAFDYQGLGKVILESKEIGFVGSIVFSIGASIFYYLLYSSRLVPRFLTIWGLLAVTLSLLTGILEIFGVISASSTISTVMDMPLALQEMVLAIWLIAKGFNTDAVKTLSAKMASDT